MRFSKPILFDLFDPFPEGVHDAPAPLWAFITALMTPCRALENLVLTIFNNALGVVMPDVPKRTKGEIIRHYCTLPEGRRQLAASMVNPFRDQVGFRGRWRKLLTNKGAPFCEPEKFEATFEFRPSEDMNGFLRSIELAQIQVATQVDNRLISLLNQAEPEVWPGTPPAEQLPKLLEAYKDFAQQKGSALLNAWLWMDFRKYCREQLNIESPNTRAKTTTTSLGQFGQFRQVTYVLSGAVGLYDVFFIPKDAGSYADVLEVESLGVWDGRSQFKIQLKVCLAVDLDKIKRVQVKY